MSLVREFKPQIVLPDIRLPGPSGIGVLKDMRNEKPPILVIMLTNYPYPCDLPL